jgi:hypothetical protein
MADSSGTAVSIEEEPLEEVEEPLSVRAVLSGMLGGVAGLVGMAPIVAGIPLALGIFREEPLANFASLVVAQADPTIGAVIFVVGGAFVLPLFFVVTASFLPPRSPEWARGITMGLIFSTSFVYVFWPNDTAAVNAIFVAVALLAHVVYGGLLGLVMERLTGIPEHEV